MKEASNLKGRFFIKKKLYHKVNQNIKFYFRIKILNFNQFYYNNI